jgi:hypothetical protein
MHNSCAQHETYLFDYLLAGTVCVGRHRRLTMVFLRDYLHFFFLLFFFSNKFSLINFFLKEKQD